MRVYLKKPGRRPFTLCRTLNNNNLSIYNNMHLSDNFQYFNSNLAFGFQVIHGGNCFRFLFFVGCYLGQDWPIVIINPLDSKENFSLDNLYSRPHALCPLELNILYIFQNGQILEKI